MTFMLYASYASLTPGTATRENSRHRNRPPFFRTRWASDRARSMWVTFRMPNAMVYESKELSGKSRDCCGG